MSIIAATKTLDSAKAETAKKSTPVYFKDFGKAVNG
jgi:hypothetical protein